MTRTLIICVGNDARGDDGVAHLVASHLTQRSGVPVLPSDTTVMTTVGLDVAMSADVAECDVLIVVDAERRAAPAVEVRPLAPSTARHTGHAIDAPGLLAITGVLYGSAPEAVLVSVAAPEMAHTEVLSATARAASEEAALVVRALCSGTGLGD